jgi:gliding motility-associated-like protein
LKTFRTLFLLLLLLAKLDVESQLYNNWYFGFETAVTFNPIDGVPGPTAIGNSAMSTSEGSASISDENGNLVFYTNGVTVYDREHKVMVNGEGLAGNSSSSQSVVIVPQPGNDRFYFVFTCDAMENSFANGYRYSVVDISLNNGNGSVISKNVLLWASGSERLTAARHANGVDVWIITNDNNSNIFRSWLLTCGGLNSTPVNSTAGAVLDQDITANLGMLKISPDGKQLCQTHLPEFDEVEIIPNFAQIFDFDNQTGTISNARSIGFPGAQISACEYSPDSRMLYLSQPHQKKIDQIECKLPTLSAILSSRVTVPTPDNSYFAIQLGPDEKIYMCVPSGNFLSVIENPNEKAPGCNYVPRKIQLLRSGAYLSLPSAINDIATIDPVNNFSYTVVDSCTGEVSFNATTNMIGPLSWQWDFGDNNQSADQNPTHFFNPTTDAYSVTLVISSINSCGEIKRNRIVRPKEKLDTIQFDHTRRCDSGYVRFTNMNAYMPGDLYTWDFGDGNISNEINPVHTFSPGLYNVRLTINASEPCRSGNVVKAIDLRPFDLEVSPDQHIVIGQNVHLYANADAAIAYSWQPVLGLNNAGISSPMATPLEDVVYKVSAIDRDGCEATDSVRIFVSDLDDIFVPTGFTPNNDGRNDLIQPFIGHRFTLDHFSVFSRWGQRVFFTRQKNNGWNGKINSLDQPSAVYIWSLSAIDINTGVRINRKGTFVLIR